HGIGAVGDQVADQARLGVLERQRAGQRRQCVAAVRVLGGAKIIRYQPQLVVAAGLIGEAIEQLGEAVHASASSVAGASPSSSSPYPTRSSGSAGRPLAVHQCTSASSWPWVTQISPAPVASIVAVRPSQSAWSEITSGSSMPRCRARAPTRI